MVKTRLQKRKAAAPTRQAPRKTIVKRKVIEPVTACADTASRAGIVACKKTLCEQLRGEPVGQLRGFARLLGVPQFACLVKEDLCKAIDAQVVTYFALQDFDSGSKKLIAIVKELLAKSGEKGSKLRTGDARHLAVSLLSVLLLALEKYSEMVALTLTTPSMPHQKRNEKLVATATETMVYLRSALLGVGGSFIDPTMLRR